MPVVEVPIVELTPRIAMLLRFGPQLLTLSNSIPGTSAATSRKLLTPDSAMASGDKAAMLMGTLFKFSARLVAVTMISPSASEEVAPPFPIGAADAGARGCPALELLWISAKREVSSPEAREKRDR